MNIFLTVVCVCLTLFASGAEIVGASLDGTPLALHEVRLSAVPYNQWWPGYQRPKSQTKRGWFVQFDVAKTNWLGLTFDSEASARRAAASLRVRPLSRVNETHVERERLLVKVGQPEQFVMEFPGVAEDVHVFADPPFVCRHGPDDICFGPGEHEAGEIRPKTGQTVWLAPGAHVYGRILLDGVRDVRVTGRGILDASRLVRQEGGPDLPPTAFSARATTNLTVEGITIVDAPFWSVILRDCRKTTIDNVKIVGQWRYNSDGIDVCYSQDTTIRNSFIRSFDDCLVARGCQLNDENLPLDGLVAENCVLWCDWGKNLEVWGSGKPGTIRNVTYRNCACVSTSQIVCDVTLEGGKGKIVYENITFEDLEVDLVRPLLKPMLQKADEPDSPYPGGEEGAVMLAFVGCRSEGADSVIYRNVALRNFRVLGDRTIGLAAMIDLADPALSAFGIDIEGLPSGTDVRRKGSELVGDWRLGEGAARVGNRLVVDVPAGQDCAAAYAKVDLSRFSEGFEGRIRCSGKDVTNPPEHWLGLKFMVNYKDAKGNDQWPQAAKLSGTFDGVQLRFAHRYPAGLKDGTGTLMLGLQSASGHVVFDLDSLQLTPIINFKASVVNADHRCAYTKDLLAAPRRRGVMLSAGPVCEDDFKTLKAWGATLVRYQMMRNWTAENDNRDLVEYNAWLDGKLDHLDQTVLPLAEKYGLSVVVDLHVVPGGRMGGDMNMFYEPEYAEAFVACWRKIARRFKGRRNVYGYDFVNEPCQSFESAPGCGWWDLQRRAAEAVREIDSDVTLVLESNNWDSPPTYEYMSPLAMTNVIYQVHMYHPDMFTHQQLSPERPASKWPDPAKGWTKELIRETLAPVRAFERKHGAKIYVGEFSAIAWAEGADRYLRDCIDVFEEYGWDWSYHAFREFPGWSVEHESDRPGAYRPSSDNPRKRVLLDGFRRQ